MLGYARLNDHLLTITLVDINEAAVTGATVSATVVDKNGSEVTGQTWPLLLTDQSDGTYTGTVEYDLSVTKGQVIYAQVTVVASGVNGYANIPIAVNEDTD